MININKHGTTVKVSIETGLIASSSDVLLYWECGNDVFAELLTNQLRKKLADRIQAIRQEEYEQGWKDAKAKKRKRTWFASVMRLLFNQS